jgi:hypothetical protein
MAPITAAATEVVTAAEKIVAAAAATSKATVTQAAGDTGTARAWDAKAQID